MGKGLPYTLRGKLDSEGGPLFCLLDGPAEFVLEEGIRIEDHCVANGADLVFSCLDERFPDLETHDKMEESLDNVFRLRVDKGERTAAYTGRCRELFEKAAREGIVLPDVARGYLMLRGARLCLERMLLFWRLRDSRIGADGRTGSSFHFSDRLGCDQ